MTKTDIKQAKDARKSKDDVHLVETVTTEEVLASSSSEDDYIHTILHLGNYLQVKQILVYCYIPSRHMYLALHLFPH